MKDNSKLCVAWWAVVNAVTFTDRWKVIGGFEQKNNRFVPVTLADAWWEE